MRGGLLILRFFLLRMLSTLLVPFHLAGQRKFSLRSVVERAETCTRLTLCVHRIKVSKRCKRCKDAKDAIVPNQKSTQRCTLPTRPIGISMTNELLDTTSRLQQRFILTLSTIYLLMRFASKLFRHPPPSRLTVRQKPVFVGVAAPMASTTPAQKLPTAKPPQINLLRGMHTVILETGTKLIRIHKAGQTLPSFLPNSYEPQQTTFCQIALSLSQASNTAQTGATSSCGNLSQNG